MNLIGLVKMPLLLISCTASFPRVTFQDATSTERNGLVDDIVSGMAVVEVRRVKAKLATFHGQNMTKTDADAFLSSLEFLNFQDDVYMPQVSRELLVVLEKLMVYCKDAKIRLEVIRILEGIAEKFHTSLDKKEIKQLCDVLECVAKSCGGPNSLVFQSTVAFLTKLTQLLKKSPSQGISQIPKKTLLGLLPAGRKKSQSVRGRGGEEQVDYPSGPLAKMPRMDGDDEADDQTKRYLMKMSELADEEDASCSLSLEDEVLSMGFHPQIL